MSALCHQRNSGKLTGSDNSVQVKYFVSEGEIALKKIALVALVLLLLISASGCSTAHEAENIHRRVHAAYYDVPSYSARCTVTAYTAGGQNDYECTVDYDKATNSYSVVSDDMKMNITGDKTVISKGENVLEAPSSDDDMSIFVNTFFKSYYESEKTSLSVAANNDADSTLLECDVINPTEHTSYMKLWVDNESAHPVRMQVYGKDNFMNTQIVFEEFNFVL